MSTLSRFRPDEFTIAMLATIMLSLLLPCQGTSAVMFEWLAKSKTGSPNRRWATRRSSLNPEHSYVGIRQ
jgi:hypothetical protein